MQDVGESFLATRIFPKRVLGIWCATCGCVGGGRRARRTRAARRASAARRVYLGGFQGGDRPAVSAGYRLGEAVTPQAGQGFPLGRVAGWVAGWSARPRPPCPRLGSGDVLAQPPKIPSRRGQARPLHAPPEVRPFHAHTTPPNEPTLSEAGVTCD